MDADSALAHWRPKELAAVIAPAIGISGVDAGRKPKEVVEEAARKLGIDLNNMAGTAASASGAGCQSRSSGSTGIDGAGWVRRAALRVVAALKLDLATEGAPEPAAQPID